MTRKRREANRPELIAATLIGLAKLGLIAGMHWMEKRYPAPDRPLLYKPRPTACAWYIYGDWDGCTHSRSPVSGEACGPVCIGEMKCKVRDMHQCPGGGTLP